MFSNRFQWTHTPNALSMMLREKRGLGDRIIDLTISNPTRAGFTYDDTCIARAISLPGIASYDPDPRGLLEARESVSEYYRQRGTRVDPSHIHLTASTSEAYAFLLKLLTNPGDDILVPRPSYPLIEYLARLELVDIVNFNLRYDSSIGWGIDFLSLEAMVGERTRAVLVINPNNPTGNYIRPREAQALFAFCRDHKLAIICDEVFFDFPLSPDERFSTAGADAGIPVFTLNGFSKILALPQMKLSWIATLAPDRMQDEILEKLDIIADTYLSVGTPIQLGAAELLNARHDMQKQIMTRCKSNYDFLSSLHAGDTRVQVLRVMGGWYAVVKIERSASMPRFTADEEFLMSLLSRQNVLIHAGYFFDFAQDDCLVVSLLTDEADFREGTQRIFDFL